MRKQATRRRGIKASSGRGLRGGAAAIGLFVSCAGAANAQLHTGDIVLAVQQGVIRTGAGVPSAGTFVADRVFGVALGAQGPPHLASNPGFDSELGTFPAGTQVGFNMLDRLYFWTGSTFVATGGEVMQVSSGETLRLSASGFVAGFGLDVTSAGQWHRHLTHFLLRGSAPSIDSGVYMLPFELWSTSGSIGPTPAFYMVYRDGASAAEQAAAIAFVRARILPPALAGDADADGDVDFVDLNFVLGEFGTSGQWLIGDVNRDGGVDFLDLNIVLGNFGN